MRHGELVTTIAILQARMSSTRMPGKVLAPLAGEPMLVRQLERILRASTLDGVVVATSLDPSDDPIVEALANAATLIGEVPVVRGSLSDVLDRFVTAMDAYPSDVVVRLTADCPLASPAVIDRVVSAFRSGDVDYVSNTMNPTYPDGLDVEVVRASVLREVAAIATDSHEREHVTLGVYRRHDRFRVENVAGERDLSDLREQVLGFSRRYGLTLEPDREVWTLSAGERQRIEIARCLLQDPRLVVLDEPTSVLTPREVETLFVTLDKLKAGGAS